MIIDWNSIKVKTFLISPTYCPARSCDLIKTYGGERLRWSRLPGNGIVFYMVLPYVKSIALIVDDDPDDLLVVRSRLERIVIEVIEAVNGVKAFEIVKDKRQRIVITNLTCLR